MMVDLSKSGRVLYISSVDISVGDGPGVNEREFVLALYKAVGERAHFLIPRPHTPISEVPARLCTFSSPHKAHNFKLFFRHVTSTVKLADRLLSRQDFDLIIFRLDILPLAPFVIKQRHHTPYVLKTLGQGMLKAFDGRLGLLGPVLAGTNNALTRNLARGALAVDSVSEMMIEYLEQTLGLEPGKVVWIDNAVNTDRFYPASREAARRELGLEKFDPVIGYVGNLAYVRGGTQLVQVAPKLLERYPDLGVVILGVGEGHQSMIDLAHSLSVSDRCVFPGYVPFDEVPRYVNALDLGVSLLLPQHYAASEQKVRQYLACGKPVVASTPGSSDFIGDANLGSLVHYDDLESIAREIDRWLSLSEIERAAVSKRASRYAQDHLSVDQAVEQRLAIWNERLSLLDRRSSADESGQLAQARTDA
jgi:glycosyltransferase involved in cell wall biosynthesis